MINIEVIRIENFEIGFERMRNAKLELAGDLQLYEYKNAEFKIESLKYVQINPSTYYALEDRLKFQKEFRDALKKDNNIDLFDLPGICYLKIGNKTIGLVPPFIEIYEENDGRDNYALQDGVHRLLLGKELDLAQKCIVIHNKNCSRDYLPYSYTNSWDEVIVSGKIPDIKKRFRRNPHFSFMRPLQSIFDPELIKSWADYGR